MIEHRVYLVGYAGRKPSELGAACARLSARLVDIRYSPRSRKPEWSGARLRALLGASYLHLPAFGNADYRGEGIRLADPESGIAVVAALLAESSVILMCQCATTRGCHRAHVADLLRATLGVEVMELDAALAALEPIKPVQTGLFGGER
ncbi:MAG: DUF488 domain-containing protein [Thermomicrobiales bacterium]